MDASDLELGDVLAVRAPPVVHEGVVVGYDQFGGPMVACQSGRKGCVVVETLDEFASGYPVAFVGYYGHLPPMAVRERALSRLGEPYSLLRRNCEHFTRRAHGQRARSPQVEAAFLSAGLVCLGSTALAIPFLLP